MKAERPASTISGLLNPTYPYEFKYWTPLCVSSFPLSVWGGPGERIGNIPGKLGALKYALL